MLEVRGTSEPWLLGWGSVCGPFSGPFGLLHFSLHASAQTSEPVTSEGEIQSATKDDEKNEEGEDPV